MSSIENDISEIDGNPAVESKQIAEKQVSNQEHSFLMDQAYVQQMQDGLLEMLDNFKNGRHCGFGMLTGYRYVIFYTVLGSFHKNVPIGNKKLGYY